ncbi:MAG: alpha/beta fold hydrolase [Marinobacter sp.]|uniref:alpha/beta fold hydrolase n=1 Tax=Marinobacter sp. TaxID=50741 RepID=UPI00299D08D6|nr:alpha/beta fold hydrolase [Marinobacter sp.]MDX1633514.1 alpha/beta fold hydrolase [Marinobacter sp.]
MNLLKVLACAGTGLILTACGGGGSGTGSATDNLATPEARDPRQPTEAVTPRQVSRPLPASQAGLPAASCQSGTDLSGGRSYRVAMPSRVDGAAIVFQVFEPTTFDCQTGHPLILQGHGFSGSRSTEAGSDPLAPIEPLVDAGYTVISIDQRGHGESGGTIRVMDPDFEGEDLVQIVDWAENHLDYLAYRQDNLLLGAVGGSYGGGFQYLLYNVDPDQRLDAMVPQITWHDLTYSLNPGDVTKNYWLLALSAMGDAQTGFSMDPFLRSSLLNGIAENRFPAPALDFLHYHSPSYFSDNERGLALLDSGNTTEYILDPITGQVPVTSDGRYIIKTPMAEPYPVDVLMFQGMRDNLFPFNEAYENYLTMKQAGGDVRLLTYPFGHHYLSPSVGLIQESIQSGGFYAEALPQFQDQGLATLSSCGDIELVRATLAWFNDKLLGRGDADNVITSGQQVCYTLTPGDSVNAPAVTVGGQAFPIQGPSVLGIEAPVTVLAGANPVPTLVPLTTISDDAVIAGIPTADMTLSFGSELLDSQCLESADPLLGLGTCDAILFAGVGVIKSGLGIPELIDEQVHPIRGLGRHQIQLTGIAERLQPGDQLVLMLYGQHPTFVGAFSRDLTSFVVQASGEVKLPLLSADGQSALAANQP